MDRKFLADLGLEKDVIDKILDQNGAETTALRTQLKTKDTEISTLRTDLTATNGKVADLEKVDTAGLQKQLDEEKAGRKADRQNWNLKAALAKAGCKDSDYVMYKLGDTVEYADDGNLKNVEKLITDCKTNYAAMFEAEPQPAGGTGSAGNFPRSREPAKPEVTKEQFDKMGYMERLKLHIEQPNVYAELSKE